MKTILVKALAARESGAMTILKETLRAAQNDPANRYVFLTTIPLEAEGVRVRVLPRGLSARLKAELFGVRRIAREEQADSILSLDNLAVFFSRLPQTIYLQNAIPFAPFRFSLRKSPRLWLYRHPMRPLFVHSVRKAEKVIVQTEWMKTICCAACHVSGDRFAVRPPFASRPEQDTWHGEARFFYPATPFPYKDHETLLSALAILQKAGIRAEVRLTLTEAQCLAFPSYPSVKADVCCLGTLDAEGMREQYETCALVFPSCLESCGLPLREARLCGAPIIAADTPFAREALEGYAKAKLFPAGDAAKLAELMGNFIQFMEKEPCPCL